MLLCYINYLTCCNITTCPKVTWVLPSLFLTTEGSWRRLWTLSSALWRRYPKHEHWINVLYIRGWAEFIYLFLLCDIVCYQMEAKVLLCKLFKNFNFELDMTQSFDVVELTSLRPRGGARVTLTSRCHTDWHCLRPRRGARVTLTSRCHTDWHCLMEMCVCVFVNWSERRWQRSWCLEVIVTTHTAVVVRPTTKFRRWPNVDVKE